MAGELADRVDSPDAEARKAAISALGLSVGALGTVVDELNVFNLPYLFRGTAHMQKVNRSFLPLATSE